MKPNFFKKATTVLVAVMSIASAAMITSNAAADYTGNYHDKALGVTFSGTGTNPHTRTEDKYNYTSSYVCSTDYGVGSNQKYSYAVKEYGINRAIKAGEGDSAMSFGYDANYCNCGAEPYITPGNWSYISNWVKERGYSKAFPVLWQKKEGRANITGVWSPDSI